MKNQRIACNSDLLRESLDDRLGEEQEEALARHLSECASCQQELERLTASRDEWTKVGVALAREAQGHSHLAPPDEAPRVEREGYIDDYNAADFAVDFLEPSTAPEAIGKLGDIDILEVIGRGGMGTVLKGYQAELKRLVAVKVLGPHLAASGPARRRFAREAQAAAAIVHPNVMPILTVNSTGKLPYLVMPYVACESLQERIDRAGPLETLDILRIGVQTASGLAAAHAQGLVHRDIKPANILLERGVERVLLTDFGLARAIDDASITRTGVIAGTPQFMSPEQAKGEPIDARSDLFSLGSVLYTLAAGRPPFRAESTYGILRRITDSAPRPLCEVNPQVPVWLAAFIDKLLAKQPENRFATAEDVAEILERSLAHVQQPATVPLPPAMAELVKPAAPQKCAEVKSSARHLEMRFAIWGGLVTSCLFITMVAVAVVVNQWPAQFGVKQPGSAANVETQSGGGAEGTQGQAATDWDSAARQFDSLRRAADELETRTRKLWDDEIELDSTENRPAEAGTPTKEPEK